MEFRHGDLRIRRPRPHRVHLFAGRSRHALRSLDLKTETLRPLDTPFTEIGAVRAEGDRVAFLGGAPKLAELRRRTRSAHSGTHRIEKNVDRHPRPRRPAHRRIPDDGPAGRISDQQRQDGVRPVLSAVQSRCGGARGREAAGRRRGSRRPDRGGIEHILAAQPVLDQPRHRGARRELRRQHRLRARISRAALRQLGRGRRRGLHQRREVPGAAGPGRREARGHHRRQRGRLHRARRAGVSRFLPGRREPLWRQRHRGAGARHAQVRVALSRLADRTAIRSRRRSIASARRCSTPSACRSR